VPSTLLAESPYWHLQQLPGQVAMKLPWFTRNPAHYKKSYKREQGKQNES
jgi:hypothetical protein